MKRHGNLHARICAIDNLRAAAYNAAKGKRNRREVRAFFANLEAELEALRTELSAGTYRTSPYEIFEKMEGKRRIIFKLPFRDRVVHWAIMQVLEPIWTPQFTADTHACIKGRGMHSLLTTLRADLRNDPAGTAYCLKIDVRKFYPTIDHEILKAVVRRKIKDPEVLGHYRYADDMVLLAGDKSTLHGWLVLINDWLETERRLSLKSNYQIFPVESRGIDFVGYVTFHTHCLARKKNKKGLCRELAKLRRAGVPEAEIMLLTASRAGFMKHCDSKHLMKTLDMKNFSDLVPQSAGNLTGTKYHIDQILNREIHLTGYKVGPSKFNSDPSLTLQYSIFEQLTEIGPDGQPRPVIDDEGQPVMDWVEHISFTGSQALIRQLGGVEITEPVRAMLIKQQIPGPGKRCFYKFVNAPDQTPKDNEPDSKLQGAKDV